MTLTQKQLKAKLEYQPDTGNFIRLTSYRQYAKGDVAGHSDIKHRYGYVRIYVCGAYYAAHRLAWLYMTGYMPKSTEEIDHEDHNTANNKWNNLKLTCHKGNGKNQRKRSDNKTGVTGISYRKDQNKWRVRIMVNSKAINIGQFDLFDDAVLARKNALKDYAFHSNHGT